MELQEPALNTIVGENNMHGRGQQPEFAPIKDKAEMASLWVFVRDVSSLLMLNICLSY